MLCTKSHIHVARITKKHVCAVKCCWILSLVRHHTTVHFSQRNVSTHSSRHKLTHTHTQIYIHTYTYIHTNTHCWLKNTYMHTYMHHATQVHLDRQIDVYIASRSMKICVHRCGYSWYVWHALTCTHIDLSICPYVYRVKSAARSWKYVNKCQFRWQKYVFTQMDTGRFVYLHVSIPPATPVQNTVALQFSSISLHIVLPCTSKRPHVAGFTGKRIIFEG